MERVLLFFVRLSFAWRFYWRLNYTWRLAWIAAGWHAESWYRRIS